MGKEELKRQIKKRKMFMAEYVHFSYIKNDLEK
jgi:hypothetical protein